MSTVRAKRADTRRQEIVESATRLFLDQGYEDTRIIDIVNDVGIAKGTFYHHFQSKEDLLLEVVANTFDSMLKIGADVASMEGVRTLDKIRMVQTSLISHKGSGFLEWLVQMMLIDPETITRILVGMHKNFIGLITSSVLTPIVKQGVEEGLFRTKYPQESSCAIFHLIIENPLSGIGYEELQQRGRMLAYMASNILVARVEIMRELFQNIIDDNISKANGGIQ